MPPLADLLATPQDAIYRDLLRPSITASLSVAPASRGKGKAESPEWPHGGEPTIRVLRDATSSSDATNRFTTLVHEPWLDSASTVIVSGMIIDWKTLAPRISWPKLLARST